MSAAILQPEKIGGRLNPASGSERPGVCCTVFDIAVEGFASLTEQSLVILPGTLKISERHLCPTVRLGDDLPNFFGQCLNIVWPDQIAGF